MSRRVPYLVPDDLRPEDRHLIRSPINLQAALANNTEALSVFGPVGRWIQTEMKLSARLREMAILQVAYVLRSEYEFSHHLKIRLDADVSDADIRAIIADTHGEPTSLTPVESAVLRAARSLSLDMSMDDESWQTIRESLGLERTMELALTIGYYNHLAIVIAALDIKTEPEYAVLLEGYPAWGADPWR